MFADLHVHTSASDGCLSPEEIIQQAVKAGLSYLAITDHDTVDGLLALQRKSVPSPSPLSIIPGIEFSTDFPNNEVHILGYFIDVNNTKLQQQLTILSEHRDTRVRKMLERLIQMGFPLDYEDIIEVAGSATSIGRPHIAQALINKQYFTTINEVFSLVLNNNSPAYVPHYKLSAEEIIKLIFHAGGIPVLAHPGLINNDRLILDIIKLGIRGLEVYHPAHTEEHMKSYETLAKEYDLVVTGGSDFHGIPGRYPESLGIFTIPADIVYTMEKLLVNSPFT